LKQDTKDPLKNVNKGCEISHRKMGKNPHLFLWKVPNTGITLMRDLTQILRKTAEQDLTVYLIS